MHTETLRQAVDVFTCCIFTWRAFTTMLPAFIMAGAIQAFVPAGTILRYLGGSARKPVAYSVAAFSGMILSFCSCNVIPVFLSIYRRGAGIGPAFAFLFAGPALNVVAAIFTINVFGVGIGIWRIGSVFIIAIVVGLTLSLVYRKEEKLRHEQHAAAALAIQDEASWRVWPLFGLLLALVVYGSIEMGWTPKIIGMVVLAAVLAAFFAWKFTFEEFKEWMREFGLFTKQVLPILLPVVFIIGLLSAKVDIKLVHKLFSAESTDFFGTMRTALTGGIFGSLMYFPILTETAFVKAFVKDGMTMAPGMALLLTGPGLSLPGSIILYRTVGWKKCAIYVVVVTILAAGSGMLYVSNVGQYICPCMGLK